MWRWDQGRLLYFQFDVLKKIAKTLIKFDGKDISLCEEDFRYSLEKETNMPFLPKNYTICRNYSRVFQCAFLATTRKRSLLVSEICRELGRDDGKIKTIDDYMFHYIKSFRFPFPAFDNYDNTSERVYPFCAIIKLLIARQELGADAKLSIDDIFNYIIANECTGLEDIDYYKNIIPLKYDYSETMKRQLREMVIFISQASMLKMYGGNLYLELISGEIKKELVEKVLNPSNRSPNIDKVQEFLEMSSVGDVDSISRFELFSVEPSEREFVEGNRRRVEHFRIERSGLLKKYYKQVNPLPVCGACGMNMSKKYHWTDYLLEIHHLLPLSSSVAISSTGTSMEDIIGLCPSCHRAIHKYYQKWLKENNQDDFSSKQEAYKVFSEATEEIR